MANDYIIPKGRIYFDADNEGEDYFGNTPGAELGVETTDLPHYSAESGIREKDDNALVEINRTFSITVDNISMANMARFVIGDVGAVTQVATPVTDVALGKVKKGRWYQLGVTSGNPSGYRGVTAVSLKKAPSTALVLGTDYTLDADLARIYILPTSVTVSDNDDLLYSCTPAANTREQVATASKAAVAGAIRFIADNAKGPNRDIYMPSVLLKPTGTARLKSPEAAYMEMQFTVEILKRDSTTAALYIDGRPA